MFAYITRATICLLAATGVAKPQHAPVPLDKGLVLTWVSSLANEPDWESRVEIVDTSAIGITLRNSWNRGQKERGNQWRMAERDLMHIIRATSRSFYASLIDPNHDSYLASTFLMAPVAVLTDLKSTGRAEIEFFVPELSRWPYTGTIARTSVEPFPVIYNDQRRSLRTVRAKGVVKSREPRYPEVRLSLVFLDDSVAPWLIEVELVRPDGFRGHKELARVSYHPNVEAELAARCRATVYDIHFATASAEIDPASSETFSAIAKALASHPEWQLQIVGHTDSIGTSESNLDLSRRRAEAARQMLVTQYRVDARRLRAEGRGEEQFIETNGTLAGRARNRRVELVRECTSGSTPSSAR